MSDRLKEAAKQRGEARTVLVGAKVHEAIATIQIEMKKNGGIYPKNGGAVSMNEVARRANISETTLFSPKQKALGKMVKGWVDSLKNQEIVGRKRVRRAFHERAEDWRKKFLDLQNSHIVTELSLQDLKAELEKSLEESEKLRTINAALLEQLCDYNASNLAALPRNPN